MGFGLEGELGRFAGGSQDDVFGFVLAHRCARVGQVRERRKGARQLLIRFADLFVERRDPVADLFHFGDLRLAAGGILPLPDFFAGGVALSFKSFRLGQERPPAAVGCEHKVERAFGVPALEHLADFIGMGADVVDVEHGLLREEE